MAICRWEGTVSTDPTVAGNWSTAAVPQAGDDVIFDATASDNCVGGDLTANQVASVTIADDCIIDIGASAADALDFDCNGIVQNRGQGTTYLNIKNTTFWNCYGSGIHSIDGIDNDVLNIDSSGTVTVGPVAATPAEFGTLITIARGTVGLESVTDQAAAAIQLVIQGGTVTNESALAIVRQQAGTLTHNEGVVAGYFGDGGKCVYNSAGTLTLGEIDGAGKLDMSSDFRAVTITQLRIKRGTFLDPHGRCTFTNPVETPDCHIKDCSIDFGLNKKYTVAAI